ncbi:MAG: PBP1A family penicillin-binding protein [bacterium]|nr:PBP1A family penicillin-binding protein [bacterium]
MKKRKAKTIKIKKIVFVVFGIYSFCAGFLFSLVYTLNKTLPSVTLLESYIPSKITRLYDRNGKVLHEFYEQRRIPIPLEDIPKPLIDATILAEDRKFYRHWGIDLSGITRAMLANILHLRVTQGGSTITQQLARNLFLTQERSVLRKIKETLLAINIEHSYSKSDILELYLNQIYYGNGAYGVESAAELYFGKSATELSIAECALLAGLPRGPILYNPIIHPMSAIRRRAFVLNLMANEGIISKEEAARVKNAPLGVIRSPIPQGIGLYFVEEVKKWVTERFGPDLLYRGGASIYTTLDIDLQQAAEKSVKEGLNRLDITYRFRDTLEPLQSAIVAIEPKTGAILSMVGGRDFSKSMFNRAMDARRQPGSAFKPFTWIAALESGYTPASIVLDDSITVNIPGAGIYSPSNFDNQFLGPVTLRKGLALSRNLVAIRLIMRIGPEKVIGYARRLGITSPLEPVLSLALGCSSVTLIDMVSAFATLANYGVRTIPFMIQKIVDEKGKLLYEHQEFSEQIISCETAYLITSLMQSVLDEGTGVNARVLGFTIPSAGKTGTTDNCTDAWFIGFTPSLACGVWVGYDQMKKIYKNATGSVFALPIWTDFMIKATRDTLIEAFEAPQGIVTKKICETSGKLATPFCESVREEVFINGTEPATVCDIHSSVKKK